MIKLDSKSLELFKEFYGVDSKEVKLLEKVLFIQNNDEVYNLVYSILDNINLMISAAKMSDRKTLGDKYFYAGYLKASEHIFEVVDRLINYYSKGAE